MHARHPNKLLDDKLREIHAYVYGGPYTASKWRRRLGVVGAGPDRDSAYLCTVSVVVDHLREPLGRTSIEVVVEIPDFIIHNSSIKELRKYLDDSFADATASIAEFAGKNSKILRVVYDERTLKLGVANEAGEARSDRRQLSGPANRKGRR